MVHYTLSISYTEKGSSPSQVRVIGADEGRLQWRCYQGILKGFGSYSDQLEALGINKDKPSQ